MGRAAALTGIVTLDAVVHAIGDKFGGEIARRNIDAATEAFEHVAALVRVTPTQDAPGAQEVRP